MLNIFMLSGVILNVIIPSVVMLCVAAQEISVGPKNSPQQLEHAPKCFIRQASTSVPILFSQHIYLSINYERFVTMENV